MPGMGFRARRAVTPRSPRAGEHRDQSHDSDQREVDDETQDRRVLPQDVVTTAAKIS